MAIMTPLEEARAFQAEATKGGQKSRGGRDRGRGHGGAPPTPPTVPFTRGGRGGGGRKGASLFLQRAVSNAAFQPVPVAQETNGRHQDPPSTPSYNPQPRKARPFAIPIVAPPSDHNDFTLATSPAGIGSSMFAPLAAPSTTVPPTGPRSQTPVGKASTYLEGSRHATAVMTPQHQPTFRRRGRGRGKGRGGSFRTNRFATREEEDEVFAFFNDDTPAPVGEVRFYQEEYVKKDSEPSDTAVNKADSEAKADGKPSTKTTSGSSVEPTASLTLIPAKIPVRSTDSNSDPKHLKSLHVNGDTAKKTDLKTSFEIIEAHFQNRTEGEKVKTKKEVKLNPHDHPPSSIGVFGSNIDINQKIQAKPQEANPKQKVKTVAKASNVLEVKAPGKSVPASSKTVNAKELEHAALLGEHKQREQQLLCEREEREQQLRREYEERKKQLLREREELEKQLRREHEQRKKQLARERVEQERQLSRGHTERKKQLLRLREIEETGQLPANLHQDFNTDDSAPNAGYNPMDDLMDMDFEPTTKEFVALPIQTSSLGFNSGQYPFTTGFPEAEEEEDL